MRGATEGSTRERPAPAVEAVLALVIERPSYSFQLWKRFEARFGQLYPVSKARIYQVIDRLLEQGLIEEMALGPSTARQPRVPYRATAAGARTHREWLAAGIQDDPRREELLRRLLATGARDARGMMQIVDLYERACLDDMARGGTSDVASAAVGDGDEDTSLRKLLIDEERRLQHETRLKFIAFARHQIGAEVERQAPGAADRQ